MRLGLIAGNRLLPIILSRRMKEKNPEAQIIAVCFKGETLSAISRYVDKTYWIRAGELAKLCGIMEKENLGDWVMAGQISPLRIFNRRCWDKELTALADTIKDFRPHTVFSQIIKYLEKQGIKFLDSTFYLTNDMAQEGEMCGLSADEESKKDIDFGIKIISRYVDLDVGQVIVVKKRCVVALESLEGTNATIMRAGRLAGGGCAIFKFSKTNQDLRFDVPVVGVSTLKLLRRIEASACVLEAGKVIILEKPKFLTLAKQWNIPVIGLAPWREKL